MRSFVIFEVFMAGADKLLSSQVIYVTELLANLILGEQESLARQAIIIKLIAIIKTIFLLLFAVFTFCDNKYRLHTLYL